MYAVGDMVRLNHVFKTGDGAHPLSIRLILPSGVEIPINIGYAPFDLYIPYHKIDAYNKVEGCFIHPLRLPQWHPDKIRSIPDSSPTLVEYKGIYYDLEIEESYEILGRYRLVKNELSNNAKTLDLKGFKYKEMYKSLLNYFAGEYKGSVIVGKIIYIIFQGMFVDAITEDDLDNVDFIIKHPLNGALTKINGRHCIHFKD